MPDIVLGGDVPDLLVILQSGATNKFALTVQVDPADLEGVEARLDFGTIRHIAVLTDTTFTFTLTDVDVALLTNRPSTVLSLFNSDGRTILGRGTTEVRL